MQETITPETKILRDGTIVTIYRNKELFDESTRIGLGDHMILEHYQTGSTGDYIVTAESGNIRIRKLRRKLRLDASPAATIASFPFEAVEIPAEEQKRLLQIYLSFTNRPLSEQERTVAVADNVRCNGNTFTLKIWEKSPGQYRWGVWHHEKHYWAVGGEDPAYIDGTPISSNLEATKEHAERDLQIYAKSILHLDCSNLDINWAAPDSGRS